MVAPNIDEVTLDYDALNSLIAFLMLKQGQGNRSIGFRYRLAFADNTESNDINFTDVTIDNDGNIVLVFNVTPAKDVKYIRIHANYWGGDKNILILENSQGNNIMESGQTYVFALKFKIIQPSGSSS